MKLLLALLLCATEFTAASQTGPCVTTACTEWLVFNGGPSRSLIYRNYSLDAPNPQITRGLVMVHGSSRDADNNFRTSIAAAFLANALNDTVVIAPRFASNAFGCRDDLASDEVNWSCNDDSWRSGGTAINNNKLTSFDFTDQILRKLASKENFPNMKAIVVAGHSAGGQYVNRYEMSNRVHDVLGVPITYVVSNPSSYAYLDASRPSPDGSEFRPFTDSRNCTTYDRWPYGLQNRTGGYTFKETEEQLRKQLASRPTTYLLGEIDILPLGGFDGSCPAMAQGPTRLARGQTFVKYVNQKFGAHHTVTVVPLCGHNSRCIFTSEPALPLLFPKIR